MPRLIIGTDTISVKNDGVSFTGQVARLIADDEIIFLIKCITPDNGAATLKKVTRNFNQSSSKYGWVNYPGYDQDEFSQAVGEEIEKRPHLLAFSR